MKFKTYVKFFLILLFPIGLLLNYLSSLNSKMTQQIYSNFLYQGIAKILISATNFLPVSVAEVLLILFVLFVIYKIVTIFLRLIKNSSHRLRIVANELLNGMAIIGVLYFAFVVMWGMNYNRPPVAEVFDYDIEPADVEELAEVGRYFVEASNSLRGLVQEDDHGVMYPQDGYKGVLKRAYLGFEAMKDSYPQLDYTYGRPKPVLLSKAMSYTGIWGIYAPFTSEVNVNINIPAPYLPSITSHEMAHQLGFAREDEANYIAYMACKLHPDIDFQYSGTLLALINVMNELYLYDKEMYSELVILLNEGVARDIQEIRSFNNAYESPIRKEFTKYNDYYLKANGQKDGEMSYRRIVDLLIAEYRLLKNSEENLSK